MTDCSKCMQAYPLHIRQGWACGHAPPAPPGVVVEAWSGLGYKGDPPKTCPGYTTTLPEVIEIARAWRWWDKGQLAQFFDEPPTDEIRLGVELFDGAVKALERWCTTPVDKGGGMES